MASQPFHRGEEPTGHQPSVSQHYEATGLAAQSPAVLQQLTTLVRLVSTTIDQWLGSLVQDVDAEGIQSGVSRYLLKSARSRQKARGGVSVDDDIKQLITSATCLEDIWHFFLTRLRTGPELDLLLFSVLDESGDYIRVAHAYPTEVCPEQPVIVSLAERQNHLVQALIRRDTTFTSRSGDLGPLLLPFFGSENPALPQVSPESSRMNIFSIPFIAGNRAIALLTFGFTTLDAFSQAKLSYVYGMRDQIAQLMWNLLLQDRMKSQSQFDSLTGLMSHSHFQRALDLEIERARTHETHLTVMLVDVNNIEEINATRGHSKGDEAIQFLASTVRRSLRGLDTVARYGGDDIVILLPETDPDTADLIAERFMKALEKKRPAGLEDLSVSIGYATYPCDTQDRDDILKLTEQALHLAKFRGSKTGTSARIAAREMETLNEKTVIEVFASHVAKKYNTQGQHLYNTIVSKLERRPDEIPSASEEHLMLETIGSLAGALEAKDRYTRGHSQAVSNYAVALAHAMEMTPEAVEHVRLAALLHDIGKIGIPEAILNKPGPLTPQEWDIMNQHPVIGARQILAPVSALRPIIPMVEHHHESWDGTGHPLGLRGEEIPLGARIVSIVDVFHALTSDRAYRKAMPILDAVTLMREGSGTKFDPRLLDIFFRILKIATPKAQLREELTV
ncbi:MAG: diguanylate cyclase [Candidatus Melainabacteria bacterium]|nr:diguanylate cyclase [Candidatus Melainabacteria bacterium]